MIAVFGVGELGGALARSLLQSAYCSPEQLLLIDRAPEILAGSACFSGCQFSAEIPTGLHLGTGDLVVIAVKPQDSQSICSQLKEALGAEALVISVMAGVPLSRLSQQLSHTKIARAMPNLGALVGKSATVFCAAEALNQKEVELIEGLLCSFGTAWRVEDEHLIDVATAVAGSGPAYLCWLLEQMQHSAERLGFSADEAYRLVLQTLIGTSAHLESSSQSFLELRTRVTSEGGTTAAALSLFEKRQLGQHVGDALQAAYERAIELGRNR